MARTDSAEFMGSQLNSPKCKRLSKDPDSIVAENDNILQFVPEIPLPSILPEQTKDPTDKLRTTVDGCSSLVMLHIMGCHSVSVKSVVDLLLHLPNLSYLGYEKIGEVFKSSSIFEANRTYRVQNFEQTVSHMENMDGNINHVVAHHDYLQKLSDICPRLKTVKLNINKDTDDYVMNLIKIKELEEVIIDFPGSMGTGFHSFLSSSGSRLTQLGLTLREFRLENIQLIAKECDNLRILHLFFANFTHTELVPSTSFHLQKLEGKNPNEAMDIQSFSFNLGNTLFQWSRTSC